MISVSCPVCGEKLNGDDIIDLTMNFAYHLSHDHDIATLDRPMIERNAELASTHIETERIPGVVSAVDESRVREVLIPTSDARPGVAPEGGDLKGFGVVCPLCVMHIEGEDEGDLSSNLKEHWDSAHKGEGGGSSIWESSPFSDAPSRNITPTRKVK